MARKPSLMALWQSWHMLSRIEEPYWDCNQLVAGVDEVGRGPLAGPVVAAAVILNPSVPLLGVRDSKLLTPRQRAGLFPEILCHALGIGVGMVGPRTIERVNILEASRQAMQQALAALPRVPDVVLTDAMMVRGEWEVKSVIHGDRLSVSIGAASIVAKVIRDRYMDALDGIYPGYGFSQHRGYPTLQHRAVLAQQGPTPCHRATFRWEYARE